jgi:tetratricopeptide (TPR) repeat protein
MKRGDKADVSRAVQRVSLTIDADIIDDARVHTATMLARLLLKAELPDLSARLVRQWPQWIKGKAPGLQASIVEAAIPVLVGLALDQDVESAANAVSDVFYHSQGLSKAAAEYLRIGRNDAARKFDAEALRVTSFQTTLPKLQGDRDSALHNLALARADQGDVRGALVAASQMSDEKRAREVTPYILRRAIDNGHGPAAGPAIEAMERQAAAVQDASQLLQAAHCWFEVGKEKDARRTLTQALKMAGKRLSALDAGTAAELMWRIDGKGKAEAMLGIVDRLQAREAIGRLVEIMTPVSPAVAVQLSDRQAETESRIYELARIAVHIAGARPN